MLPAWSDWGGAWSIQPENATVQTGLPDGRTQARTGSLAITRQNCVQFRLQHLAARWLLRDTTASSSVSNAWQAESSTSLVKVPMDPLRYPAQAIAPRLPTEAAADGFINALPEARVGNVT